MATELHLVTMFKMRGVIPPLPILLHVLLLKYSLVQLYLNFSVCLWYGLNIIVSRLWVNYWGSVPGKDISLCPDRLWGPPSLLSNEN
jgi:hypothetical protein